jgi:hypothetical protein
VHGNGIASQERVLLNTANDSGRNEPGNRINIRYDDFKVLLFDEDAATWIAIHLNDDCVT